METLSIISRQTKHRCDLTLFFDLIPLLEVMTSVEEILPEGIEVRWQINLGYYSRLKHIEAFPFVKVCSKDDWGAEVAEFYMANPVAIVGKVLKSSVMFDVSISFVDSKYKDVVRETVDSIKKRYIQACV